jgi:predicted N-acetyltransferase YhbS
MLPDIKIRNETNHDYSQKKSILDNCFGPSRLNRTVYMYRQSLPIKELSLISCFNDNPTKVVGTISFYRVLIEKIDCLLLGPLAVDKKYQGKGFGKKLIEIGLEKAKSNNEKICFVSGEYSYYKEFGFDTINNKNLNISIPGPLSYDGLLICELANHSVSLLQNNSELLPLIN